MMMTKHKNTLVSLYEFYLKSNKVVDDNRHKHDVNVIDAMQVDDKPNILAQFKKHWQEEDSVENINEIEKFLVDGCEDSNDDKLDILGWWKCNVSKYNILLKVAQNVLAIPISTVAFKLAFISLQH